MERRRWKRGVPDTGATPTVRKFLGSCRSSEIFWGAKVLGFRGVCPFFVLWLCFQKSRWVGSPGCGFCGRKNFEKLGRERGGNFWKAAPVVLTSGGKGDGFWEWRYRDACEVYMTGLIQAQCNSVGMGLVWRVIWVGIWWTDHLLESFWETFATFWDNDFLLASFWR